MLKMTMTRTLTIAAAVAALALQAGAAHAQAREEVGAITARVHGTFQDNTGGLGVLSGDMTITRFEVRNGSATAVGSAQGK